MFFSSIHFADSANWFWSLFAC